MKKLIFIFGLILALASPYSAQTEKAKSASETDDSGAIRLETSLVNLNVRVTDIGNRPLVNLKREDFLIFENGEAQEIAFFEPVTAPVNLLLLLDLSNSTKEKRKVLMQAVRNFIDALGNEDRMAVAAFTRKFYLLSDFTGDRKQLKKRIEKANDINGGTAYYDSMWRAFDFLRDVKDSRKAIVVLTDGEDNAPWDEDSYQYQPTEHEFDELLMRAEEEDASVYPIYLNLFAEANAQGILSSLQNGIMKRWNRAYESDRKRRETARRQLEALAEATAGSVFSASREEDLDGVYQRVAAELHQMYSLAYAPKKDAKTGEFRKIIVKVTRDGARAKTRRGYYAK